MSGMPRKIDSGSAPIPHGVPWSWHRWLGRLRLWVVVSPVCFAAAPGCATSAAPRAEPVQTIEFLSADRSIRITAWSGLPRGEAPPVQRHWLESFLYGPSDTGAIPLLRHPQGLAAAGNLLVCDQGWPDVLAVDPVAGTAQRWTAARQRPACPIDIALDAAGRAYVADSTLGKVLVYDTQGRLAEELAIADTSVERSRPSAVLLHRDVLYVADAYRRSVWRYHVAERRWLEDLPAPAPEPFGMPTGLAITADGTLLVVDTLRAVVHRFEGSEAAAGVIGARGRAPGQFVRPLRAACTPSGLILVTDAARQSVQVFDERGAFVLEIAAERGWPGFTLPFGVAVVAEANLRLLDGQGESATPGGAEWIVVTDTLSAASLTLLRVERMRPEA